MLVKDTFRWPKKMIDLGWEFLNLRLKNKRVGRFLKKVFQHRV